MYNLLFEIIMSNECNKRCSYCKLDFFDKKISNNNLDFLNNFLNHYSENIWSCIINFFWGEPLLNYEWIQYFVEKTKHLKFVKYSIWTNWILLSEEILDYFIKNNFTISLSLDSWNTDLLLQNKYLLKGKKNIQINYIINPKTIEKSFSDFDKIIDFWFKNINIMPVYFTIKWSKETYVLLKKIVETKIKKYIWKNWYKINFFSYYNWVSTDIQYILDTDWYVYSDLDSLLWIQKQWWVISTELKHKITKLTKIDKIESITLENLISWYNVKEIIRLVNDIPKEQWFLKDYKILDKIFNG